MKEVEKQLITKIITQDLGIFMHLKGGHYIEEAVTLALQERFVLAAAAFSRGYTDRRAGRCSHEACAESTGCHGCRAA